MKTVNFLTSKISQYMVSTITVKTIRTKNILNGYAASLSTTKVAIIFGVSASWHTSTWMWTHAYTRACTHAHRHTHVYRHRRIHTKQSLLLLFDSLPRKARDACAPSRHCESASMPRTHVRTHTHTHTHTQCKTCCCHWTVMPRFLHH